MRRSLSLQVFVAVVAGIALGHFWPVAGLALKPGVEGFFRLIKLLVAPIIFTSVVLGVARVGDLRTAGPVGLRALVYFEAATTLALLIGWVVARVVQPGAGIHVDLSLLDTHDVEAYASAARAQHGAGTLLALIPTSVAEPFVRGDILQVLVLALLTGTAMATLGATAAKGVEALEWVTNLLGNAVATLVVSRWEGAVNFRQVRPKIGQAHPLG